MKVGIITFQRVNNYGAVLQSYALQQIICRLGVECETIDYQRGNLKDVICWQKNKVMSLLKGQPDRQLYTNIEFLKMFYLEVFFNKLVDDKFKKFRLRNQYSKPVTKRNIKQLNDKYDLFIAGSDQVWNCGRVNLDATYLLDFVSDKNKKGSYAASFGIKDIPQKYKDKYVKSLRDYKYLSVREQDGIRLLKELVHREASLVLDPTLLLDASEWKVVESNPIEKDKYILIYQLGESPTLIQFAKELAKKTGYKILTVPYPVKDKEIKWCKGIGPEEWLALFHNAEYIVTNSFHGVAFSINFEKQFFVEITGQRVRAGMGSRIENILDMFELHNRLLENGKIQSSVDIDYRPVSEKLTKYREQSIGYIKDMLGMS